jgi:hypothetical protein
MTINYDRMENILEKRQQIIRQNKAREARQKKAEEAKSNNRNRIIGEIIAQYFPEVMRFQPRRSYKDNQVEFAPLICFVSTLAADKEYIIDRDFGCSPPNV